jgi:hypothetical protein
MTFCKDQFWNSSVTWDTDNPNFTSCFRNTLLTVLPCGILWLAAPFWFWHLKNHATKLVSLFSNFFSFDTDSLGKPKLSVYICTLFELPIILEGFQE